MGEVFISYKQEERERMRPIADGLRALGVDIWFDAHLRPDRAFTDEIGELINTCRAQLVCWSPAAVASEWVRGEAEIGRQRGVLVAAMLEPCSLPPPFNMHHAESLVGWSGDGRHPGWRKIVDAIGRKLERPGLGELAALQASEDAAAWKSWARKYPADPQADAAWAKAEELDIAAARARTAREREASQRKIEPAAPPAASAKPAPAKQDRSARPAALALGAVALVVVLGAGAFVLTRPAHNQASIESAPQAPIEAERLEEPASPPPERQAAAPQASPSTRAPEPRPDPVVAARAHFDRNESALDRVMTPDIYWMLSAYPVTRASLEELAQTDARAQVVIGVAHLHGVGGFTENAEDALRWFRRAAAAGNARGQYEVGNAYLFGRHVASNSAEAARWYRLAAEQGHPMAQSTLGWLTFNGDGVPQDRAEALRLYRLAARQGEESARQRLRLLGETW